MTYKGYSAKVSFSDEDMVFYGKILGITDLITFEATTVDDLKTEFEAAVDDYIEICKEIGKNPEKEYKGQFNVRISPTLHKKAAIKADKADVSLNKLVENALNEYLKESKINATLIFQSSNIGELNQEMWKSQTGFDMSKLWKSNKHINMTGEAQ